MKYIFNAFFPQEQLFNLTADPYEIVDVAASPDYSDSLKLWRSRMVAQFEAEGRGPTWVKDGELQQRTKGQLFSPNWPGLPPAEDMVDLGIQHMMELRSA
eukprot:Plantae.Rhodophyta-Rhodochaete_pulchella.ctg25825.p1 GENE.Plantae.Rhodophyta-Rhodochaete_pulchella.ctg25825~~Plantae.Rhodophyta-Rhodochaete_pulchella.ctg25825.p1  ORF type:complete len:100 (+),score=18.74 Plantae.Rhodophyta-Rhodochaete_pulchella.ctg25825:30-329(+)